MHILLGNDQNSVGIAHYLHRRMQRRERYLFERDFFIRPPVEKFYALVNFPIVASYACQSLLFHGPLRLL